MDCTIKTFLLFSFITLASCVKDDDYSIPSSNISENTNISSEKVVTFKSLYERYEQAVNSGNLIAIIDKDEDIYLEAYVVSSDLSGNFYEELILQNKTDDSNPDNDPRLGLKIDINVSSLSDTYEFGRKVYVKLSGLSLGKSEGVLVLAKGEGQRLEQIQEFEYRNIIIRTNEIATITPKSSTMAGLTKADINTLIKLDDMQLNRFEIGATYASESFDEYDGLRLLESCESGFSLMMQTSTFSNFKSLIVPQGQGSISGIYSRDFTDTFDVIIPNSAVDVKFVNSQRCDPIELNCGLVETLGDKNLFRQTFESQKNNKPVSITGWTNYIEAGSKAWEAFTSTSSNASLGKSVRVQAASSGDVSNIAWLITPAINLDVYKDITFKFKTSNSVADTSFLEVLYSLNWDGTTEGIASATWGELSAAYVVKDSDSFVQWYNSGPVNLSCTSGMMHIAFKYTGGGFDSIDGVYELDEISVDYSESNK